jgi:hypothetical protein
MANKYPKCLGNSNPSLRTWLHCFSPIGSHLARHSSSISSVLKTNVFGCAQCQARRRAMESAIANNYQQI